MTVYVPDPPRCNPTAQRNQVGKEVRKRKRVPPVACDQSLPTAKPIRGARSVPWRTVLLGGTVRCMHRASSGDQTAMAGLSTLSCSLPFHPNLSACPSGCAGPPYSSFRPARRRDWSYPRTDAIAESGSCETKHT